jgi:hypothetical protein
VIAHRAVADDEVVGNGGGSRTVEQASEYRQLTAGEQAEPRPLVRASELIDAAQDLWSVLG